MSGSTASSQYEWAKSIPCRNIQIHGFCKWENKGCSFSHDKVKPENPDLDSTSPLASALTSGVPPPFKASSPSLSSPSMTPGKIVITSKENPGVPFQFPNMKDSPNNSSQTDLNESIINEFAQKPKFNFNSASFTPSTSTSALTSKFAKMSPKLDSIPAFVPSKASNAWSDNSAKSDAQQQQQQQVVPPSSAISIQSTPGSKLEFNPETAAFFTPSQLYNSSPAHAELLMNDDNVASNDHINSNENSSNMNGTANHGPHILMQDGPFYQQTSLFPINYHLYAPTPPPHIKLNQKPNEKTTNDLFIPAKLRELIQMKNEESLKSISATQSGLPLNVDKYHSLYPIDNNFDYNDKSFGYISSVYKCVSNDDGRLYTMRRLQNVPISSEACFKNISKWKSIDNNNIAKLHDAFTTRAFGDNSLILVYDYYPMSLNLMETHFFKIMDKNPELITEDILWLYLIQLVNATSEIHKKGLVVKYYNPTKIIVSNKNRIKLSSIGIQDVIDLVNEPEQPQKSTKEERETQLQKDQYDDIQQLGNLILNFSKTTIFIKNPDASYKEIVEMLNYSAEFKEALMYTLDTENESKSLVQLQKLIAPMIMKMYNELQTCCDYMESSLSKEVENSRLVRLMARLDFIFDRPESVNDKPWSETSERYPIKLFRDYLFNQLDEMGKPLIDLTHVINNLNKLDAGVEENLLLVSEDEMSCLIISFKDLKNLVEVSFNQLRGQ